MKKEQFIKNLRYSLRKLKKDEREKYLAYYEEIGRASCRERV